MKRPLCAICDSTNQTVSLCAACRSDPINADWSEADEIPRSLCVSADTDIDLSYISDEHDVFRLGGRRLRRLGVTRTRVFGLLYGFTLRVAYRNRGRGRRHRPWVWRSRPLNLSEIAWLVGISPQAAVQSVRFELDVR